MLWCIIGGSGFIGKALVRDLLASGQSVVILDRKAPTYATNAPFFYGDIGLAHGGHWIALEGADVVVNLAALSGIADCDKNPLDSFSTNVLGVQNILDRTKPNQKVVMASSGAVVAGQVAPVSSGALPAPLNAYGRQKAALEALCAGLDNVVCLRFSNVYGPGGIDKSSAVHAFTRAAIRNEPLLIHGNGTQRRDFVYVSDVVEAIEEAGKDKVSGILHVATGTFTTIDTLAALVLGFACAGHTKKVPGHSSGALRAALSLDGNPEDFCWAPSTMLVDGLRATVEGFRKHYNTQ